MIQRTRGHGRGGTGEVGSRSRARQSSSAEGENCVCTEMCLVYVEFELRRNISFTYADMLRVYFVYLLTEYTVVS